MAKGEVDVTPAAREKKSLGTIGHVDQVKYNSSEHAETITTLGDFVKDCSGV